MSKTAQPCLTGKPFEDPIFGDFAPAIRVMLAHAKKAVTQAEGDSAAFFKTEEEKAELAREKKKALEEIEGYLVAVWPSVSIRDKQMKAEAIFQAFGTRSWTAVEELRPEELRTGYKKIVAFVQETIGIRSGNNKIRKGHKRNWRNAGQVRRAA